MKHEDKDLLLKDLCARLPYGIKVNEDIQGDFTLVGLTKERAFTTSEEEGYYNDFPIELIKPYLFPLSSMTEEQKRELRQMDAFVNTFGQICFSTYDDYGHELIPTFEDAIRIEKWLNKNHFDYRGLIEKGLAIDATGLNIY